MPTTANYGWPYPALTGVTPDVPRDLQALADPADVDLKAEETARIAGDTGLSSRRLNTAGTSLTNATNTTIPYATSVLDEIAWDGTNHRYAVPTNGYYAINAGLAFVTNGTGLRIIRILINGTAVAINSLNGSSNGVTSCSVSAVLKLTAGDQVSISAQQSSGGSLALTGTSGYNYLDITRVGLA